MPVTAANVRDVVTCSDCGKRRCLFAAKKLGKEEAETLEQAKEDVDFVCGGSIFVPDHPLASKVGTRLDISCSTDVTSHYFASKRGLPLVCFKCGSANPLPVAEEVSSYSSSNLHILCAKNALRRRCVNFALEGRSRCAPDCQTIGLGLDTET